MEVSASTKDNMRFFNDPILEDEFPDMSSPDALEQIKAMGDQFRARKKRLYDVSEDSSAE